MTAIVHGFGRFIRADVNSINLVDLIGFKCLIAVDDLADIPEHLSISMGDFITSSPVRIESTAPFGGEDCGIPFVGGDAGEGGDQTDPRGITLARRAAAPGDGEEDWDSREGLRSGDSNTWNSSEIRDRRRAVSGGRQETPALEDCTDSGVAVWSARRQQLDPSPEDCGVVPEPRALYLVPRAVRSGSARVPLGTPLDDRTLHLSCLSLPNITEEGPSRPACLGKDLGKSPIYLPAKSRGLPRSWGFALVTSSSRGSGNAPEGTAHVVTARSPTSAPKPPLSTWASSEGGPTLVLGPPPISSLSCSGPPPFSCLGPPPLSHPGQPRPSPTSLESLGPPSISRLGPIPISERARSGLPPTSHLGPPPLPRLGPAAISCLARPPPSPAHLRTVPSPFGPPSPLSDRARLPPGPPCGL